MLPPIALPRKSDFERTACATKEQFHSGILVADRIVDIDDSSGFLVYAEAPIIDESLSPQKGTHLFNVVCLRRQEPYQIGYTRSLRYIPLKSTSLSRRPRVRPEGAEADQHEPPASQLVLPRLRAIHRREHRLLLRPTRRVFPCSRRLRCRPHRCKVCFMVVEGRIRPCCRRCYRHSSHCR